MSYNDEYEETGGFPTEEDTGETFPWSFTETCGTEEENFEQYGEEDTLNLGGYGAFLKGFASKQAEPTTPVKQIVSGVGIVDNEKMVSADENEALLAKLNEENKVREKAEENARQKVEEEQDAEAEERRKATERLLEERYKQEQEEKAKREEAQRLLEKEEAEAEEKRHERNPFYRIKTAITQKRKDKEEKAVEEEKKPKNEPKKATATEEKQVTPETKKSPEKKAPKKRKSKEADWEYIATHDRQTDLLNQIALEQTAEEFELGAVIHISIKDFLTIKERYDAKTETEIVRAFANVLKAGYEETAYRIGTDEFVLLCKAEEKDNLTMQFDTFVGKAGMASYSLIVGSSFVNGDLMAAIEKAKEDGIAKTRLPKSGKNEAVTQDYNALLTKEQRELKEQIQENHTPASKNATSRIIAEIQSRQNEVNVILIASANFDALFIIQNINTFVRLVIEMDHLIDYSYLYVVYDGGAQYYGTDEYLKKVTNLFEDIAEGIMSRHILNKKDVAKVKGINVFKNIYFE